MFEMTCICGKWRKYFRNGKNKWEMTLICGKWLKYVGTWLINLTKRLKNVENDLEIGEMAKILMKWLKYMGQGFSI